MFPEVDPIRAQPLVSFAVSDPNSPPIVALDRQKRARENEAAGFSTPSEKL
jgi:hypothetical protein